VYWRGRGSARDAIFRMWARSIYLTPKEHRGHNHVYKHFIQVIIAGKFPAECTNTSEVFLG
jgi:hypothetical protein